MAAEIDPIDLGAAELARRIGTRELGAVAATRAFLDRIERLNPRVNALCTLNPAALDEAREVDRRLAAGAAPRPLEGVPFVVKDIVATAGLRTTFGSRLLADDVPAEDAVAVERLKAAGGVMLGKTNTPEFAHNINTTNFVFGTTRNPWNLGCSAGGSSGGTGAAVAARFAPIGIGTDLGGSIRIPSALNGLAGIRPVPGRVPYWPSDFAWDLLVQHVAGPMCASVEDCGLMLAVMAGPDDRDPASLPAQGLDFAAAARTPLPLAGRRIAYSPDLNGRLPVDPQVAKLAAEAADTFRRLGATVEEACFDLADLDEIVAGTRAFGMVGRYADRYDRHKDLMTPPMLNQVSASLGFDVRRIVGAERLRSRYWHRAREFLSRYDFLLTPAVGVTAWRLDRAPPSELGGRPLARFGDVFVSAYAFSVTGLPSMSVPAGFDGNGMPAGLQIVGPRLREDLVLSLAAAYAAARPELFRRPEVDETSPLPPDSFDLPGVRIA